MQTAMALAIAQETSPRADRRLIGLFMAAGVLMATVIGFGGWFYYQRLDSEARLASQDSLGTIADLKAADIAHWMAERRGDAEVARISIAVRSTLAVASGPAGRSAAFESMRVFRQVYGYAAVVLADSRGRVQLIEPPDYPLPASYIAEQVQIALHSRNVQVSDLRRARPEEPTFLWITCPVIRGSAENAPADGALLLAVDPRTFLFPNLQRWPTPSQSGEVLLALREHGELVYLNDLRQKTGVILGANAKSDADRPTLAPVPPPNVGGVLGATDFRGVPVFAALRSVQGTPWLVLAKVDQEEIFAPLRREAWNVVIIVALLTIATLLGIYCLWRQHKLVNARRQLEERTRAEYHIHQLNRLYAVLSSINELIVRERNVQALLSAACGIAVNPGDFRMAWIGMLDTCGRKLEPVASSGVVEGYLDRLKRDLTDPYRRAEPSARAVLSCQSQVCNDLAKDPQEEVWQAAALLRGYRSYASSPLKISGKAVGALTLFAGETDLFDPDELCLLEELAGDISFALEVNQKEAERQRAETEMRASEERFRLLIENASDIITVVNDEGIFRFVSPSAKRCLGYEADELLNRNVFDLIDPQDVTRTASALHQLLANPAITVSVEYRFLHRDGSWRVLQSVGRNIPGEAPDGYVVVNSRDITESRELEKQFRHSQKMEAVGQLAGGVAHDFNNILAATIMQTEIMTMTHDLPGPVQDGLAQIRLYSERAANLTRQLLMFSRKQVMQPCDLNLNEIVTNLSKMLQRIIGEQFHLQLDLDPHPLWTLGDPGMLDQVLMNLVVNARDAMPGGGNLVIETGERAFSEEEAARIANASAGRYVWLRVADAGCGISRENLQRIFEPFFTTKAPGHGTGLGLATVFGIVRQHRGMITVESELERGTTFQIYLPVVNPKISSSVKAREKSSLNRGTETILLVEDEAPVRQLTRSVLEREGYSVLEATNGVDAQKIWIQRQNPVHLLVTDMVMPEGVTGRQLADRLREHEPNLKVVFVSGYSADNSHRDFIKEGGGAFLQKPFSPNQLLEIVRTCLDG